LKIHGTAKGAALSTKDFGVAFGGVPAVINYDSGIGSGGDLPNVANLTTDSAVASPSGLGDKSWLANGSNTRISGATGEIFPVLTDFTLSYWFRPEAVTDLTTILAAESGMAVTGGARTELSTATFPRARLFVREGGDYVEATTPNSSLLSNDTWYHYVGTFDADTGTAKVYIDAVEKASSTNADCGGAGSNTTYVIMEKGDGTEDYTGRICDMSFWNVVLSSDNIDSLYASGDGATADTVQKDKIVCYWDTQTGTATIKNLAIPP